MSFCFMNCFDFFKHLEQCKKTLFMPFIAVTLIIKFSLLNKYIIVLTVHLYFKQSLKYAEAENFFRITTGIPSTRAGATPSAPPEAWYMGNGLYITSSCLS